MKIDRAGLTEEQYKEIRKRSQDPEFRISEESADQDATGAWRMVFDCSERAHEKLFESGKRGWWTFTVPFGDGSTSARVSSPNAEPGTGLIDEEEDGEGRVFVGLYGFDI